jgi:hypothetical protein
MAATLETQPEPVMSIASQESKPKAKPPAVLKDIDFN